MTPAIALLLVFAMAAANLPFMVERLLLVVPLQKGKHLGWHALELIVLYFLVGGASLLLEGQLAQPHPQNWEFYAVTGCLFLVFAFPGFTYRYLWRKR